MLPTRLGVIDEGPCRRESRIEMVLVDEMVLRNFRLDRVCRHGRLRLLHFIIDDPFIGHFHFLDATTPLLPNHKVCQRDPKISSGISR